MFSQEEKVEASVLIKEEAKKEGVVITLLLKVFPVLLRILEKAIEKWLAKKGYL